MTFQDQISGQRFKLINERTGNIVEDFSRLDDAQKEADRLHAQMPGRDHFRIVEIVWCGGSKRLSDIDARKASQ
jgi:hypothetical protein